MDSEKYNFLTKIFMKELGKIIEFRDKVHIYIIQEIFIKAILLIMKEMDLE